MKNSRHAKMIEQEREVEEPGISDIPKKRIVILQSNYIPWKGYFDLIARCDEFVLYDEVQYTIHDWRNRNQIKTPHGLLWLTIPIRTKGRSRQKIKDARIADTNWSRKHWKSIVSFYGRAPYFREYRDFFEDLYLGSCEAFLSDVNRRFLEAICGLLGITTQISSSSDHREAGDKTERIVDICRGRGATELISGPAAKAYLRGERFSENGMVLTYMDYSGYPVYRQLYPPFEHHVSIVDLVLHAGPKARSLMKY